MPFPRAIVVAGTDTDVGKTVFAAGLSGALEADYWKPIQAGLDGGTDSKRVAVLGGLPAKRIHPEAYRLNTPASPHLAAEIDGIELDVGRLKLPTVIGPLVVELAGGLLVPLTRSVLQIDVVAKWQAPVVLVARTALGTINHSLLSIEALRQRGVEVVGIAFVGDENPDSEKTISEMGCVKRLGRLPHVNSLTADRLADAFAENFDTGDFR